MVIKKIQNSPDTIVEEFIEGYMAMHPGCCERLPGLRAFVRVPEQRKEQGKVKLVGGGGSGHGPGSMAGVRRYGRDCGVMGDIYAAPSWMNLVKAFEMIDDGSPMLMTVANHAGDVMNSTMAYNLLKQKGVDIHMVINYSDIATAPKGHESERRGTGGCLGKITSIAAEEGEDINTCIHLVEKARDNNRSYGFGIRSAVHPVTGLPIMPMPDDEIELGIGVHGESSGNRIKMPSSKELAVLVMDKLIDDLEVKAGEEIALNINGLGGITIEEFSIFFKDINNYLKERDIKLWNVSSGNNMVTQELGGMIVSIGRVDDEIKYWWNPHTK